MFNGHFYGARIIGFARERQERAPALPPGIESDHQRQPEMEAGTEYCTLRLKTLVWIRKIL